MDWLLKGIVDLRVHIVLVVSLSVWLIELRSIVDEEEKGMVEIDSRDSLVRWKG